MAAPRASLLPPNSPPDAGSSKGAHAGPSKGGIACTADTGPPDGVESTAQAIGLYSSITYSSPSAIPSYSPTTRLHRHPLSKGGEFASDNIACTANESPCTRAHCPSHPLPGAGTGPTCTLHRRQASPRACHLPDAHGQNHSVSCRAYRLCRSLQDNASRRGIGICRSLPGIIPVRHARGAFGARYLHW